MAPVTSGVETGERLFNLVHRIRRVAEQRMSAAGVSMARAKALMAIETDGPIRQRALADRVDCTAASLTDMVDGLERDGFAVRTTDPTDRRASLVSITPAGRTTAQAARNHKQELLDEIFGELSPVEQRQLIALLDRVSGSPILNGESE